MGTLRYMIYQRHLPTCDAAYILDANAAYKDFADLFIVKLILGTCKGSIIIGFFIMTLIYYTRNEQTI